MSSSDPGRPGHRRLYHVDRDTAGRFGITVGTVDNALYDAFGQRIVSTIFTSRTSIASSWKPTRPCRIRSQSLSSIYLPSAGGGQVPLTAVAKVTQDRRRWMVGHLGQFPATTVSFNLAAEQCASLRRARGRDPEGGEGRSACRTGVMTSFQGAALAFQNNLSATNCC